MDPGFPDMFAEVYDPVLVQTSQPRVPCHSVCAHFAHVLCVIAVRIIVVRVLQLACCRAALRAVVLLVLPAVWFLAPSRVAEVPLHLRGTLQGRAPTTRKRARRTATPLENP